MKWTQAEIDRFEQKKCKITIPITPTANTKNSAFALGRMKAGKMNKTEALYSKELERQKQNGQVIEYWFEAVNLRIAEKCFYKPDFLVMNKDCVLELHETKGWVTDDALVKIKAVADKYPFPVKVIKLVKGSWEVREF